MIRLTGVSKSFHTTNQPPQMVLDNVSLSIAKGKITGLIGPSGAGKSTLLRLLNGLVSPDKGAVAFEETPLPETHAGLRPIRQEMGMIFQHFNLLNTLSVFDNIALPLRLRGDNVAAIQTSVTALAKLCDLTPHLDKSPHQLSGGQKQRVAIARALSTRPKVLLADEPTSALDPESTQSILDFLTKLNQELGLTIVIVTHEMQVVKQVCDNTCVLDAGCIVEQGPTLDLFLKGVHPTTQNLVAEVLHNKIPELVSRTPQFGQKPLYRISYLGERIGQPLLSDIAQRFQVRVNIMQASISPIKGQTLGVMLVTLSGDQVDNGIQYLTTEGCIVEHLGYVA